MTTLARHALLVGSTVLATLALRSLVATEPAGAPIGVTAPVPAPVVDHGRALNELRNEVARLRQASGAVAPRPGPPTPAEEVEEAEEAEEADPAQRREAWTRASDVIGAAESRGTWTATDAFAMAAELRVLPDEDRRELLTRVHVAIAERRMDPRPRITNPEGAP